MRPFVEMGRNDSEKSSHDKRAEVVRHSMEIGAEACGHKPIYWLPDAEWMIGTFHATRIPHGIHASSEHVGRYLMFRLNLVETNVLRLG